MTSIIVPVYNSADLILRCHGALAPIMDRLAGEAEIIYVDDGSRDTSLEVLGAIQTQDPRVRIVELAANFGQHAAIFAGFEHAHGAYFITLDVDLQCDPAEIPRMLALLAEGYDFVAGVRVGRDDPIGRRVLSWAMTKMVASSTGIAVHDAGCSMNAMTRDLAALLAQSGEMRRFAKPLALQLAKRSIDVRLKHAPRPQLGRASSYSLGGLVRSFMDFLVIALGDVFGWVFLVSAGLGAFFAFTAAIAVLAAALGKISPLVAIVCAGISTWAGLSALLALTGDYVRRIHRQGAGAPMYLVRRVHEGARPCKT